MVFKSRSSDRASILVVAVPILTRAKILGIERDLLDCELEVAALPGHGLDDLGGVEPVAAEPAGSLCREPHPRLTELDRIRPTRSHFLRRGIVLRPRNPRWLDTGTRTDRIDGDVVCPRFERKRFDEAFYPVLDGAVRDLFLVAADTRAARDADDVAAALRLHPPPGRVGAVEQSTDADVDLARPFLRRDRIESDQRHIDRVVHHNI